MRLRTYANDCVFDVAFAVIIWNDDGNKIGSGLQGVNLSSIRLIMVCRLISVVDVVYL